MIRDPENLRAQCVSFGHALLDVGDLDPVYTLIRAVPMNPQQYAQTVLGYLCFYHLGVSARLGMVNDWYGTARELLPTAPRGTERRHFRGRLARDTLDGLEAYGQPADVIRAMSPAGGFREVSAAVQQFTGFGPWIAFKAADLFDRTGFREVPMGREVLRLYRDPLKGISLWLHGRADLWAQLGDEDVGMAVDDLLSHFSGRLAPPDYQRPLGPAEAETIFCKFKSHLGGRYPVGKDVQEVLHGLHGWGPLAVELGKAGVLL